MITLDATKGFFPENGRHSIPLSAVSTVAFVYASENPVALSLVNPDGEVVRCGTLSAKAFDWHKLELRNYVGLLLEEHVPTKGAPTLFLQVDVRHKVGEVISPVPLEVPVSGPLKLSEQEKTRRIVMRTLMAMQVMPDDDQLSALEAELGFDFEADEFGDYLEPDFSLVEPEIEGVDPPDQEQPGPTSPAPDDGAAQSSS